ncbi:amidohydrolase family protein [Sphingosinicella sp.]|jgi:imidazolonepropionase-like amidohydrolase|uniref:metal-dependent hydrolase family protein n=1 Tax=Sphingosinicella sp. TaxID=1917971 RepID=UPI0026119D91|nr:amidohydrolase family protein [Sphingosinicella sp.]MEA3538413.1 amidohydrolase family protein [Pseudomonadota bacterium]
MRRVSAVSLALLSTSLLAAQPAPTGEAVTLVYAGTLLAEPGKAPRGPSTIVIRNGKIAEVRDGYAEPQAGAKVVDLKDRFVLPGLIDLHVHFWGIGGDPLRARLTAMTSDEADEMMYAVSNARVTLDAGFTTVRDLGGSPRGIRALRDGIERGDVEGPTIVNAGAPISVSGGHGDPSNGLAETYFNAVHQHQINTCDGPDDCRRAVRQQVALGAQVIKFMSTGGVLSNVSGGLGRSMTDEEIKAVIDTAHGLGRKVATHSHHAAGTKAAIPAGVDTVDHGSFLDDEAIKLLKTHGTWLVPTMLAANTAVTQARAGALPPAVIPKAEEAAANAFNSHKKAFAAGVKVAFGTDSGVSKHGDNAKEFALLVKAGLSPAAALQTATVNAAEALGRSATIGTITPGKDADIIAVAGSPLDDVTRMESVDFVMRRGVVHKAGGKRQGSPAD